MSTPIDEEDCMPFGIDCVYVETAERDGGVVQCFLCYGEHVDIGYRNIRLSMFPGTIKIYLYYRPWSRSCTCYEIITRDEQQYVGRNDTYDIGVLTAWVEENIIGRL